MCVSTMFAITFRFSGNQESVSGRWVLRGKGFLQKCDPSPGEKHTGIVQKGALCPDVHLTGL